jgi:hypothetical protein
MSFSLIFFKPTRAACHRLADLDSPKNEIERTSGGFGIRRAAGGML